MLSRGEEVGNVPTREGGSSWSLVSFGLGLLGAGLSVYSLMHHLEVRATGQTNAACNINDAFSCDEVALSAYAEVFGLPLGVWGIGYFSALLLLTFLARKSAAKSKEHLAGYAVMVVAGSLASVVLAAISAFSVGAYCLTCIGIYLSNFGLLANLWQIRNLLDGQLQMEGLVRGVGNGGMVVAAVAGVYYLGFKPAPNGPQADSEGVAELARQYAEGQGADLPVSTSPYAGLGEDFRKGNDNASVVIQEFADFQCPACGQFAQVADQLHREYGGRLLIVFRNYPLDSSCNSNITGAVHPMACEIAVLARCAGQFGKFWEYHDLAFAEQRERSAEKPREWAERVGLSKSQIEVCLASDDIMAKIKEDIALGDKVGVRGTPAIYINGQPFKQRFDLNTLRAIVDAQLVR